jgi:hypothetical protein
MLRAVAASGDLREFLVEDDGHAGQDFVRADSKRMQNRIHTSDGHGV